MEPVIADLHDIISWVFVISTGGAAVYALTAHSVESLRGRPV